MICGLLGLCGAGMLRGAGSGTAGTGSITGAVTIDGVTGSVQFSGMAPPGQAIDMSADAYCQRVNAGRAVLDRPVMADAQGGLMDVVIHVREGPARGSHPLPADTVLLDQLNCAYVPGMLAVRANQPIVIRNSDETLHNVHVRAQRNREFNIGQPMKGTQSRRTFPSPEVGMSVACDIHGWMRASISVFDHPYFAVTQQDGTFGIAALPPGDYVLEAWHATLGTQQQRVTVSAGAPARVSFTFAAR